MKLISPKMHKLGAKEQMSHNPQFLSLSLSDVNYCLMHGGMVSGFVWMWGFRIPVDVKKAQLLLTRDIVPKSRKKPRIAKPHVNTKPT